MLSLPPKKFVVYLTVCLVMSGCAWSKGHQAKIAKKRQELVSKREKYTQLNDQLSRKEITAGIKIQTVRETFGGPDNIFRSASSVSHFEVWTYEYPPEKNKETNWSPIRLYFDNGQLVSWGF